MLLLKALRHPAIFRLWVGQALSSIGDEIYRVGLTWLAVGLIGADTGYLSAAQAAALMILSFVGGKWADHWNPLHTMVRVDMVRAFIVLIPVLVSFFMPVPLTVLVIMALSLSALGAFFDPALQTVLPAFSPDASTLRAATGLMGTTIRMARMMGPAIVGFLAGVIPPVHFFTMDAFSFFISAFTVRSLQKPSVETPPPSRKRTSMTEAIAVGFRAARRQKGVLFLIFSKALTGGTWNLSYGLGFALLVQQMAGNDARAFGMVIASYGLGNFAGALYFGNLPRHRPALMMYAGFVWLGIGFILMTLAPNLHWVMVAAAFSGFSGTMNEITFFDMIQSRYANTDMTRIFRLRMALDTSVTLLLMLLAPFLFKLLGIRWVISLCGVVWVLVGITGLVGYLSILQPSVTKTSPAAE